jgi:hypothetical protein
MFESLRNLRIAGLGQEQFRGLQWNTFHSVSHLAIGAIVAAIVKSLGNKFNTSKNSYVSYGIKTLAWTAGVGGSLYLASHMKVETLTREQFLKLISFNLCLSGGAYILNRIKVMEKTSSYAVIGATVFSGVGIITGYAGRSSLVAYGALSAAAVAFTSTSGQSDNGGPP